MADAAGMFALRLITDLYSSMTVTGEWNREEVIKNIQYSAKAVAADCAAMPDLVAAVRKYEADVIRAIHAARPQA